MATVLWGGQSARGVAGVIAGNICGLASVTVRVGQGACGLAVRGISWLDRPPPTGPTY
jgi:hypothetical protein